VVTVTVSVAEGGIEKEFSYMNFDQIGLNFCLVLVEPVGSTGISCSLGMGR
jgi:hypothetical protein